MNAFAYVGHGEIRERVIGADDRAPTPAELDEMRALVRQAMNEGAFGLSTGLFYVPGYYATTEEVIELARVAAAFDGIYDTHDRDLGASYRGVGYLNSIREAIRIGEQAGLRVIFSHFNAQGAHNYGRAPEGARLIEEARARGVEVAAAQHVYTATQSSLAAYAIPRWASNGGRDEMLERFRDPETVRRLDVETMEMLAIRGGAGKLLFADPRPELNGRTLAAVASGWDLPVPAAVRRILAGGNAAVMNLDLYDIENTRYLARQPWMMTCTDGRTPSPAQNVTHPRVFGAFTRKLRQFVVDEQVITMPFAIRSMTGLAADFLRLDDRGYLRVGAVADVAVLDRDRIPRSRHLRRPATARRGHGPRARQRPLRDTRRRGDGRAGRPADSSADADGRGRCRRVISATCSGPSARRGPAASSPVGTRTTCSDGPEGRERAAARSRSCRAGRRWRRRAARRRR